MSAIGNLLWFILGGFLLGLCWWIIGLFAFITIVGIPWGKSCFVMGEFSFFPFGKEAIDRKDLFQKDDIGTGGYGLLGNIIWFIFAGMWLALGHVISALICFVTIIGIPFAIQHLKLASLALSPIGKTIVTKEIAAAARKQNAEYDLSVIRQQNEPLKNDQSTKSFLNEDESSYISSRATPSSELPIQGPDKIDQFLASANTYITPVVKQIDDVSGILSSRILKFVFIVGKVILKFVFIVGKVILYIILGLVILGVIFRLIHPFHQSSKIISDGMSPTILKNDYVLVNKIFVGTHQRGDIVYFHYTGNAAGDYVSRIVGLPGDHVQYNNKMLVINGTPIATEYKGIYKFPEKSSATTYKYFSETLGTQKHDFILNEVRDAIPYEATIPSDTYFMMCDNRDECSDSRQNGLVLKENIYGKAYYILKFFR